MQRPWLIAGSVALFTLTLSVGRFARDRAHPRPGFGCVPAARQPCNRLATLPSVILWAWERPEDLRFLTATGATTAGGIGVSFLAETLALPGRDVVVRPRLQPLKVAPGTPLMACARIELDRRRPPALTADQASAASAAIARLSTLPGVAAVQVDFDATASERTFYADLLSDVRRALPPSMPLSVTALTSWCTGDPWVAGLPVDEAVPMLFRMGADARDIRMRLEQGRDFAPPVCRGSLGISTDEPFDNLPSGRRLYVFRPGGWSLEAVNEALARLRP